MTNQTLPHIANEGVARSASKEKILVAVLLGLGGVATFSWVALLGWGVIYLIGSVTG